MSSIPKLSVIMPVYNAGVFLFSAIDSILKQTFTDYEFIIIDDGSTDDSLSVIKQFSETDSRIHILSRENKGLLYSLNEGISLAKGEFIARMDADDISMPLRFEKQLALMDAVSLDICGCHFVTIDEANKKIDSTLTPLSQDALIANLALTVPFAHGSVMIRNQFLLKHHLQYGQEKYTSAEDYALWAQMFYKGARFGNVDEFLFQYREYSTSVSKLNTKKLKLDAKNISKKFMLDNEKLLHLIIFRQLVISLSQEEKNHIIGCILYISIYSRSFKLLSCLTKLPVKNTVNMVLKFLSRRFF